MRHFRRGKLSILIAGRICTVVAVSVVVLSGCSGRRPGDDAPVAAFSAHLDRRIPGLMDRYDIPGVAIALVEDGRMVWAGAYGYADVAEGRPMTTRAVCRAESISKSVTAWGVMKLVEQGRIDPAAPVSRYLSEVEIDASRFPGDEVTIARLLSNSAGMPIGTVGPEVEYAPGAPRPAKRDYLAGETQLVQAPGGGFLYSNVGFNLLEIVVENVTGRDFEAYMKDEVLEPLGMRNASYAWEPRMRDLMPTGYELDGTPVPPYVYPVAGSGGLFADVEDLARFVSASVSGSGGTSTQLHTPAVEVPGLFGFAADAYGYGHFTETLPDGRRAVWHGGQGHGWMTHFHAVPESGNGVVILTNSQRSWPFISYVLTDWARWSGAGRVKFGAIVWASRALRACIAIIVLLSLAGVYRLGRELIDGRRRFAPFAQVARGRRAAAAAIGIVIAGGLLWAVSQPYLFVSWIFPATAGLAGWSLVLAAAVLIAFALLPP